jgi:hypothetical protein
MSGPRRVRARRLQGLGHHPARRGQKLNEGVPVAGQTPELGCVPHLEPRAHRVPRVSGHPLDLGLHLLR